MQEFKFKTSINCGNCIKRITPSLDKLKGINYWNVDINNPDKVLTVMSDDKVDKEEIIDAIRRTGFDIESID